MAFDLLYRDGREFTGRPLRERRARLENIVAGGDLVLPVRRLAKNGFEAWTELIARLRGSGREGRNEPVRGRADAAVAEGKAEGLDRLRRSVAAANQRSDIAPRVGLAIPSAAVSLLADLNAFCQSINTAATLDGGPTSYFGPARQSSASGLRTLGNAQKISLLCRVSGMLFNVNKIFTLDFRLFSGGVV